MPNIITTARGERIDLDVFKIKAQLAQAPMKVDVETRKTFIDKQEQPATRRSTPPVEFIVTPEVIKAAEDLKILSNIEPATEGDEFKDQTPHTKKK